MSGPGRRDISVGQLREIQEARHNLFEAIDHALSSEAGGKYENWIDSTSLPHVTVAFDRYRDALSQVPGDHVPERLVFANCLTEIVVTCAPRAQFLEDRRAAIAKVKEYLDRHTPKTSEARHRSLFRHISKFFAHLGLHLTADIAKTILIAMFVALLALAAGLVFKGTGHAGPPQNIAPVTSPETPAQPKPVSGPTLTKFSSPYNSLRADGRKDVSVDIVNSGGKDVQFVWKDARNPRLHAPSPGSGQHFTLSAGTLGPRNYKALLHVGRRWYPADVPIEYRYSASELHVTPNAQLTGRELRVGEDGQVAWPDVRPDGNPVAYVREAFSRDSEFTLSLPSGYGVTVDVADREFRPAGDASQLTLVTRCREQDLQSFSGRSVVVFVADEGPEIVCGGMSKAGPILFARYRKTAPADPSAILLDVHAGEVNIAGCAVATIPSQLYKSALWCDHRKDLIQLFDPDAR